MKVDSFRERKTSLQLKWPVSPLPHTCTPPFAGTTAKYAVPDGGVYEHIYSVHVCAGKEGKHIMLKCLFRSDNCNWLCIFSFLYPPPPPLSS